jgi:hypothetical protein
MPATGVRNPSGLQVAAYGGANCVLIAMSVPDNQTKDLAGFTIWRRREGEAEQPLLNRLNFDDPITSATTPAQRKWTSSEDAPFQKFRWVDIPPDGVDKPTTYRCGRSRDIQILRGRFRQRIQEQNLNSNLCAR